MNFRANYERRDDRETLERLKRWPSLRRRFPRVRILSGEHGGYWFGDGHGYTSRPEFSNVLCIDEAIRRTEHCGPEKRIQFIDAQQELQS